MINDTGVSISYRGRARPVGGHSSGYAGTMMDETVRRAQLGLPVAMDRETRLPVTLEHALAEPDALAAPGELTAQEQMVLVRSRWEAGDWSDVLYCEDLVDLARAIAELEANSELGKDLQRITERAIEMVLEDARG